MWHSTSRSKRNLDRLLASAAVGGLLAGFGSTAYAGNLPSGGVVVGGSATISQTSATQMQITSTTARSAISWQDFSIGQGYGVNVTQPTAASTQLEQVRGTNVSQIFGSLTSNGRIVIANPNGIWFGPHAQVDVAGLTATTAHATASDIQTFVNGGSLALSQAGNANAAVINQGNITISNAGLAAFVAPGVRNDGIIQAKLGTVQLSSGTTATLDFYGDGLVSIAVSGQTLAQAIDPSTGKALGAAVTNTGTLNADGGTVLVTANTASNVVDNVINVSGVVQARSVSTQNGQIVLDGGSNGAVQVAGSLDASGTSAGQTGGTVKVLGQQVALNAGTKINVSGDVGGGKALIGGNFHGAGPERTQTTYVDPKAAIDADAVTAGNGGQVAVWSDQATVFNGTITARGGSQSGNGGYVETSGAQLGVGDPARVDTSASQGAAGTWLLDPKNISVVASGGSTSYSSGSWTFGSSSNTTLSINASAINGVTSGTVVLQANTDITISSAISNTNSGVGLTLNAGRSIIDNANITLSNGAFTATINDAGAISNRRDNGQAAFTMASGTSISTGGGSLSVTVGSFNTGASFIGNITLYNLNAGSGGVSVIDTAGNASTNVTFNGVTGGSLSVSTNGGTETLNTGTYNIGTANVFGSATIPVTTNGTLTLSQGTTFSGAVTLGSATTLSGGSNAITFAGTVNGANALTVNTSGATTFGDTVGATTALASLTTDAGGTTTISGGSIRTTGAQSYGDAVMLGAGATLTSTAGGAISFGSTVGNTTSRALAVNTTGNTTFGDVVGGGTALASLTTDAGGTTVINTTAITTSGTQTYNDAITLGADATLTTTNSLITLGGNVSGSGHALALSTGSGGASLSGATLAMLSVATSGTVSESAGVTATDLLLTGAGAFNLTGPNTVGTLAASVGTGSISFNNGANNLEIGSVGGTSGVTAGALTLSDTAAVSQSAPIDINTLTLNGAGGAYTLTNASNDVTSLAGDTGSVSFREDSGFDIVGLTASNGITLSSTGIVTQSGAVTATGGTGTLTLNGVNGTYQLDNAANRIGHLSGSTGRITYSNSNGFDIAGVTLDSRFTLYSMGAVTQSGVISVPNLVLTGTGATFTLTSANSIDTVAAQTGSLSVTDASTTLTVGAIGSVTGITTTGNVTLAETAASGGLDIDTTVSAGGAITASTVNGNITVHAGVTLSASAGGDAIVLKPGVNTAAGTITGGDFVNDSGASALSTPSGNWVVYTGHDNSGGTVVDGLTGYTARYNTDTTNFTPSAGINYILYRVAPTLTVTPGAVSVTYDGTTLNNAAYSQNTANYAISGFINGDTATSAALSLSGSMAFNDATGTAVRNAGTYTLKQGSLSFANSPNYAVSFSNPTPNAYVINQRPITVTAATNSKTYDAGMTAAATPTVTSGSIASGDTANFTESFGTKNAGSNLTLTPAGTVTDGNSGNNYAVTFVNNTTGAITAAPLTITTASNTKTYDGGVTAAALPTVSGLKGSDSVTGLAETYTDKNAGTGKTLTVSAGYVVNDDNNGNNYTVTTANNTTGVINQRQVTLSGSRTYDGSTGADASILAISNNVNGDNLTLSGTGTLESADVGTQHFASTETLSLGGTAASNYSLAGVTTNGSAVTISSLGIIVQLTGTRVYDGTTNAPAGILTIANKTPGDDLTLSGTGHLVSRNVGSELFADAGSFALAGTAAPNYTLTGIDANGSAVSITARPITVTATANTKTYDATNSATATPTITSGSLGSGDSATWIEDYDGNKNAGTGLLMVPTGTISDGNSGANYDITFVNTFNGVITAAPLTITAVTNTKTYDGGVTAAAIPTYSGTFGSDSVTGLAETYTNKNAGSGKTLTVSSGYTVNDGNDGNNYTVSTASNTTGVINQAALTISAVANTKTYDAGITAAATPTVSGLQGSDTASGVAETYGTKNAGTGKQLSVSAYAINDGNSGNNYTVSTAVNNSGVINAAPLTITAATDTKVYDGGVSAAARPTVSGLWGTDTVTGLAEQYNTKHARTGKTLTVTSYTVNDGNSGANYIVSLLDDTTGVITRAPLTITAVTNTKTYDATTTAAATPTVSGLQTGDSVGDLAETYDNKNAATGKTLAVSAYNISDGNGGNNYTVSTVANNTGVISQKALTVTAQANSKTYDGGVTAAILPLITAGALQGTDTAVLSETYDNKNTGSGKTLTPLVVINDGVGGANYTVTYANNTAGEIDKASLSITADNKSKIVGTDNPTLTASYTGLVGGDTSSVVTGLSLATTATTTSPVGTYAITASGGTATNYVISYVDGVLTITVPASPSAPSGSVVQVTRQAFYPGEPMPHAFGPTPMVNLGIEVGGVVTEGEVAGVGPFPGEGYYLEDAIRFANDFLSGGEDLQSEP